MIFFPNTGLRLKYKYD